MAPVRPLSELAFIRVITTASSLHGTIWFTFDDYHKKPSKWRGTDRSKWRVKSQKQGLRPKPPSTRMLKPLMPNRAESPCPPGKTYRVGWLKRMLPTTSDGSKRWSNVTDGRTSEMYLIKELTASCMPWESVALNRPAGLMDICHNEKRGKKNEYTYI